MCKFSLIIIAIYLSLFSFSLKASDSIKPAPKYILDISFSHKSLMFGNVYDISSSNILNDNYKVNINSSLTLNYNYLISKQFKKSNQFYLGVALNYTSYNATHYLYSQTIQAGGKPNYTTIDYSKYEFNHTCNALSIAPNLSYYLLFNRIVLMNRLGVYFTENFSKQSYGYDEKEYTTGPKSDPAHITPSNPEGWYYATDLVSTNSKQDHIDDISFNLFYNVGLGIRIKKIMPFVNIEATRLSKTFKNSFIKLQIGVSYLF